MRGQKLGISSYLPKSNHILILNFLGFCSLKEVLFMKHELLSEQEMQNQISGEALTLTAVMAVLATAIIAVIVYRMFMSEKGSASVPGGWKFSWN